MKVVCDSYGCNTLCIGCGAAIPHYDMSCEPCPVNTKAICVAPSVREVNGASLKEKMAITHDALGIEIGDNLIYTLYIAKNGKYLVYKI
jgi:hypothetical protein